LYEVYGTNYSADRVVVYAGDSKRENEGVFSMISKNVYYINPTLVYNDVSTILKEDNVFTSIDDVPVIEGKTMWFMSNSDYYQPSELMDLMRPGDLVMCVSH